MKAKYFLLPALAWLAGCKNFTDIPGIDETLVPEIPISELVVPEGFKFEMTRTQSMRVFAQTAKGQLLTGIPFDVYYFIKGEPKLAANSFIGDDGVAKLDLVFAAITDSILVSSPPPGIYRQKVAVGPGVLNINLTGAKNFPALELPEPDVSSGNIAGQGLSFRDPQDDDPSNPIYYTPAKGEFGTIAFEDLFPDQGDYDFNDIVVDYNFREHEIKKKGINWIEATFILRAMGGARRNGFGFQMEAAPDKIKNASGYSVEANQSKATIIVFDDGLAALGSSSIANTRKDRPFVGTAEFRVKIHFNEPVPRSQVGYAPYNMFTFINGDRGKEVHLPGYPPTDLASPNFPTSYQTSGGFPFGVSFPTSFQYPVEGVSIDRAYLKFTNWAASRGVLFSDWNYNQPGYLNQLKLY